MVNYQDGKIYKVESITGQKKYYGGTCRLLKTRMKEHIRSYMTKKNTTRSSEVLAYPDAVMTLVELYPCSSKKELTDRERWYIQNNLCCNLVIPGRTDAEYRADNKDYLVEKSKIYYTDNKEAITEQHKIYRSENSSYIKEHMKIYRAENAVVLAEKSKIYRTEHVIVITEKARLYRAENTNAVAEYQRLYQKQYQAECRDELNRRARERRVLKKLQLLSLNTG